MPTANASPLSAAAAALLLRLADLAEDSARRVPYVSFVAAPDYGSALDNDAAASALLRELDRAGLVDVDETGVLVLGAGWAVVQACDRVLIELGNYGCVSPDHAAMAQVVETCGLIEHAIGYRGGSWTMTEAGQDRYDALVAADAAADALFVSCCPTCGGPAEGEGDYCSTTCLAEGLSEIHGDYLSECDRDDVRVAS